MSSEKIFSLICAVTAPIPMVLLSAVSVYGAFPPLPLLCLFAGGAAAWLLGALAGLPFKKIDSGKKLILARAGIIIGGAVTAIAAEICLLSREMGDLSLVFYPLALIFWFHFGVSCGSKKEMLTSIEVGLFCVENAFVFPCCSMYENGGAAQTAVFITIAVFAASAAAAFNKKHMTRLALRGKSANHALTKASEQFNLQMTAFFSLIMIFLFFFARWGAAWLQEACKALVSAILGLFSKIGGDADLTYAGPNWADVEIEISPTKNTIVQIILLIIITVIIILAIKPIIRMIRNFAAKKMRRERSDEKENYPYADFYESDEKRSRPKNSFARAVRSFRREKDPNKKFRLGYKAFMLGNKNILPSDSTSAHIKKSDFLKDCGNLPKIVEKYDALRYNDESVTLSDCEPLENMLANMRRRKGKQNDDNKRNAG